MNRPRAPRNSIPSPLKAIVGALYRKPLLERGPALTFPRLCTSRHLGDLQWMASLVVIISLLGLACLVDPMSWRRVRISAELVTAFVGAVLGALSFLYQTASRRIGTVDLFASEISVLCRIFIVADFAKTSVARAETLQAGGAKGSAPGGTSDQVHPPSEAAKFSSEEQYTPAYDNHLEELAPLDADVITHVTEFYFYRKVMVDSLRALPSTGPTAAADVMAQMIYMQFLMYESARMAVDDLIEFEPRKSESLVSILCSELVVYGYLYDRFGDDYRAQRLHLRRDAYRQAVVTLLDGICEGGTQPPREGDEHPLWLKARTTGVELLSRYQVMCRQTGMIPLVPPKLAKAFAPQPVSPPPEPAHIV